MSGVHPEIRGIVTAFLAILMTVVALVLLIAATNVAAILLARSVTAGGRSRFDSPRCIALASGSATAY